MCLSVSGVWWSIDAYRSKWKQHRHEDLDADNSGFSPVQKTLFFELTSHFVHLLHTLELDRLVWIRCDRDLWVREGGSGAGRQRVAGRTHAERNGNERKLCWWRPCSRTSKPTSVRLLEVGITAPPSFRSAMTFFMSTAGLSTKDWRVFDNGCGPM